MRKHAFTLIELLVVVAIIAILISILLPALHRARDQAKSTVCASRLHQLGTAMYCYWTEWNGRVPYCVSPMTNGRGQPPRTEFNVPGFGSDAWTDEDLDPFNRELWPMSLPNILMPTYLGSEEGIFRCPAAKIGWPRESRPFRYTYRPAAVNQPNGIVLDAELYEYFREHFAFMDGRMMRRLRIEMTGNAAVDAQRQMYKRGTYLRDLVQWENGRIVGPHRGGVNVLNRDLQVEFRDQDTANNDLAPNFTGAAF